MKTWSTDHARDTYCVPRWSDGYFDIDADGDMVVQVHGARDGADPGAPLRAKLCTLCDAAADLGLRLPLLLRFEQILTQRAGAMVEAFATALDSHGYAGGYTPVYPIKVNQQQDVVRALTDSGDPGASSAVGLEAGSKPELIAVLAVSRPGSLVVCNGYKDRDFIRLALLGGLLGMRVIIVIEKPGELDLVLEQADELGIEPDLGVRLRLASVGGGNWQNSGGQRAKFGLAASQLLALMECLRKAGRLDRLQLLHFHMGSQIAQIAHIRRGLKEALRYFVLMTEQGANLRYLDVGGGIGVDYEGSASRNYFSINYRLDEYADSIVDLVAQECRIHDIEQPHLITEAGRAMTAHHAVLVTDVVESEPMPGLKRPHGAADNPLLTPLARLAGRLGELEPGECLHRADDLMDSLQDLFSEGSCDLATRAAADELFYWLLRQLRRALRPSNRANRALIDELDQRLADKYFCNFSIFQSLPDVWGLNQVFPIVPLRGLDRRPEGRAVLEDLTCDSDGRIDRFVDANGIESALAVHPLDDRPHPHEPYRLAIFLVGAYQETLGDIHNLFGDTDVVNVRLSDGVPELRRSHGGDSAARMLRMVGFDPDELLRDVKKMATLSGAAASHQEQLIEMMSTALNQGTYLRRNES